MTERRYDDGFVADCLTILRDKTQGRVVHRRRFLQTIAALGVLPTALRFTPAHAASDELVIVNWGGDAVPAFQEIWADPWVELGRQGLLEEVDWAVVDPGKLRDAHRTDWGVGSYLYSFALTWDRDRLGRRPETWADFWNVADFPGTRTLRNNIEGMLEAALMADGVAPGDVYPIDVERALEKVREIKEHTIFWTSGSQSQELFRNGEVVIGNLWHTRARLLRQETDGRVQFHFNQGVLFAGAWVVPKGNPGGAKVWDFIAATQDPASQVALFERLGNGPINPEASAMVPEELRVDDPGSPENFARQVVADSFWYADNYADTLNRYTDLIAS